MVSAPKQIRELCVTGSVAFDINYTAWLSYAFNLLAYAGVSIFTWGIPDKKRRANLWLLSGIMMVAYAHYTGNPIFIWTQTLMTTASFMLWKKLAGLPPLITFLTGLVFVPMILRGDINSLTALVGALAALGLVFGIVFNERIAGLFLFLAGGALMILYARMVGSGPFFWLNVIFTAFILVELAKYSFSRKSV